MNFTVRQIAEIIEGKLFSKNPDASINGFSIDSRSIKKGEFFIALKGKNHDGHNFCQDALSRGASGLIIEEGGEEDVFMIQRTHPVIIVKNTYNAIGKIASEIRRRAQVPVICVTGTNGKTTVKDMLAHILSSRFKVLSSPKSYNNIIGLSLTLFNLEDSYDFAVVELGTNKPGEIRSLAEIACPNMAIITNIGRGHLEFFLDKMGVFAEKISLVDSLSKKGQAFLNGDDEFLSKVSLKNVKFFGSSHKCDFLINKISKHEKGINFSLNNKDFFLPLEGRHNVYNAAPAIAIAESAGIEYSVIKERVKDFSLQEMRFERREINGIYFVNDAYNANPDSFRAALDAFEENALGNVKGVIAGDMLELGEKSNELHKEVGRNIAEKNMDFLITVGARAEYIALGAIEGGMDKKNVLRAESHKHAAISLRERANQGAVILLKASRASRMEEVLKCFTTCCIH